jgi:hypothetical protein
MVTSGENHFDDVARLNMPVPVATTNDRELSGGKGTAMTVDVAQDLDGDTALQDAYSHQSVAQRAIAPWVVANQVCARSFCRSGRSNLAFPRSN